MKIEVIDTGCFYADGGAMFGAIPKSAWQRRYPCTGNNRCILSIRSLLVCTDCGRIILIDTGVSDKSIEKYAWYGFYGMKSLYDELLLRNIRREDVTDVIFTHLHFDHCGNTDFPNARYWISSKQWGNLSKPHSLEASSFNENELFLLAEKASIILIDDTTFIGESMTLQLFDGHSTGQIVPVITTPSRDFIYAGDVIPLSAHISPEWISAYDLYPSLSYDSKITLLEGAVAKNSAVIYCHDFYKVCTTIKKSGVYFRPHKMVELHI